MKTRKIALILSLALFACFQILMAQTKEEQKEMKAKEVKEQVDAQKFKVWVDRVVPMSGRTRNLTSDYSLEVRGDSVISHLPYFGRAYSLPYGGGVGMRFEEPMMNYKLSYNKKGTATITFRARSEEDTHTFRLQVYPNASVTIQVISMNRQGITYYGTLDIPKDDR